MIAIASRANQFNNRNFKLLIPNLKTLTIHPDKNNRIPNTQSI